MSEFSVPPPLPPPSKPFPWKIVIPVAVVLLLCCCCVVIAGVVFAMRSGEGNPFSFLQTGSKSVTGDWDVYYSWGCAEDYSGPVLLTFYEDGSFQVFEDSQTSYGTWYISDDFTLEFIFDEYPNAHYVGILDSEWKYVEGT
ncbi:MAG: hypothetical protein NZL98_08740, partial [Anaerolineales bacterium]|nr:hypothetical protein [Anaerolineales bacterium]